MAYGAVLPIIPTFGGEQASARAPRHAGQPPVIVSDRPALYPGIPRSRVDNVIPEERAATRTAVESCSSA